MRAAASAAAAAAALVTARKQVAVEIGAKGFRGWGVGEGEGEGGLPPALDPAVSLKARQLQVGGGGGRGGWGG